MSGNKKNLRRSRLMGFVLLVGISVIAWAGIAHAQVSFDFPTQFAGFSSQDIKVTIANIVRIVLGFIGILFFLLILYGGFIWMTSGGVPDKINRAKKMIVAAVIGLLITLSSYAIAGFIVTSLQQAVGGGPGGGGTPCTGPGCFPISGCPFPTVAGSVKVCSVTNPAFISQVATITGYNFLDSSGNTGPNSRVTINGIVANPVVCGTTNSWGMQQIVVEISQSIPVGTSPQNVVVTRDNGAAPASSCDSGLLECGTTNVQVGTSPFIRCMTPTSGPSNGTVTVRLDGKNFGLTPGNVQMQSGAGPVLFDVNSPLPNSNITLWSDTDIRFTVPAAGAPQQAITGDVEVRDSGGLQSNGVLFTVTCNANNQCGSNCCFNNTSCQATPVCAATGPTFPVITAITPDNGEEGNYITVSGNNFGPAAPQNVLHFRGPDNIEYLQSLAACTANWSNTQIIMLVPSMLPAGPADPDGSAQVWVTTPIGSSNVANFTVNDTVRPGLCQVNPNNGVFRTLFNLNGNNFTGASRDIYFGNRPAQFVSAQSQNFTGPATANAIVPNILASQTTVAVLIDGEDSNPLVFTVNGVTAGDPVINGFSPANGPTGTYVTIFGANFANIAGTVHFVDTNNTANTYLADTNFPLMCSSNFWYDDHIVVKVPGAAMPLGSYFFLVTRYDTKTSPPNLIANINGIFTKDTTGLRPGLCRIDPTSGPAGTPVRYDGEGFGSALGNVWFDLNQKSISIPVWNNQQVLNATVPAGAVTGTTTVQSSALVFSNSLPFTVGSCTSNAQCAGGTVCCTGLCRLSCTGSNYEENNWVFTADEYAFDILDSLQCNAGIQTPTPYPYDQTGGYAVNNIQTNAPVNSAIAARFTRDLNFSTIASNVRIFECADPAAGWTGGAGCVDKTASGAFVQIGSTGFKWEPNAGYQFNDETWYEVRLDNGTPNSLIKAQDGSLYHGSSLAPAPVLGAAGTLQSFRWHFRTRALSQGLCQVSDVALDPAAITVPVSGTAGPMTASPISSQCYICSGSSYNYSWDIALNGPPPFANFNPLIPTTYQTRFDGVNITPVGNPRQVRATITNPPSGPAITSSVPALMTVQHVPPRVISFSPSNQCTTACINAIPSATFNVPLAPATVNTTNVRLMRCTDATCTAFTGPEPITPQLLGGGTIINFQPLAPNLLKGQWYRAILDVGITNTQGQALSPQFSWTFQTSLTVCNPDAIAIVPAAGVINAIGGTFDFNGRATASICGTMNLNPAAYSWTWLVNPGGFASLAPIPPALPTAPTTQATAIVPTLPGAPVQINASIASPALTATPATLEINDLRDKLNLIGHRPDSPAGTTPPEPPVLPAGPCRLGGTPAQCPLQCTNVLASAIFSTYIDENSLKSPAVLLGPVAHYKFDDGTTKDSVAPANVGVLLDDATVSNTSSVGSVGGSLLLDGNGNCSGAPAISCRVDVSQFGTGPACGGAGICNPVDSLSISNPLTGKYTGTMSFWVRPTVEHNYHTLLATQLSTIAPGNDGWGYMFYNWDSVVGNFSTNPASKLSVFAYLYEEGTGCQAPGGSILAGGAIKYKQWNHIVMTYEYDGTDTDLKFYVDGQLNGTFNDIFSACTGAGKLRMGTGNTQFGDYTNGFWWDTYPLEGSMDEIAFFDRALAASEVQSLYLQSQPAFSSKFYVKEAVSGSVVPGTLSVSNYTDTVGVCQAQTGIGCSDNTPCQTVLFPNDVCNFKRGRVDFSPSIVSKPAGVYNPVTGYEVNICTAGSCAISPILSTQGFPYTAAQTFGFRTGANVCKISFLDITPNPMNFNDVQRECVVPPLGTAQCINPNVKFMIAVAKDVTGVSLTGVNYIWRETTDKGGSYASKYYSLDQPIPNFAVANAQHHGVVGSALSEVTATSSNPAINLGSATAQGQMNFDFCENPWYGNLPLTQQKFYIEPTYDFTLSYCRDSTGANKSDPLTMLPNLPAPHIQHTAVGGVLGGGDLLKEDIFIVDTSATGGGGLNNTPPYYVASSIPTLQTSYKFGDLVSFRLEARDDENDHFLYVINNENNGLPIANDILPVSASFNQKTGTFIWVIDALPTDDDDGDGTNDFKLDFTLNPLGGVPVPLVINIQSGAPTVQSIKPVVQMTSPAFGDTITIDYALKQSFIATVMSLGSTGATAATGIKSFVWDFQDSGLSSYPGVTAPVYSADHIFLQSGVHQVTFRVQNNLNVWSDPTVVNVIVRPKLTSLRLANTSPALSIRERLAFGIRSWFNGAVLGQTQALPPTQLTADSVNTPTPPNPKIQLNWKNNGVYDRIEISRVGGAVIVPVVIPPGVPTTYLDQTSIVVGTDYVYKVCGGIGFQRYCTEVTTTARNVDFDVIVSRVYKNLGLLPIDQWYAAFAPNAVGSPTKIVIDGYEAIVDGTSTYIGMANCGNLGFSGEFCVGDIYNNVLLISYNLGAKKSTIDIFTQLINNLKINSRLIYNDSFLILNTCSDDPSVICNPGGDDLCQAKNAGLCTSARAELRRDRKRVVDLHLMKTLLDGYATDNSFCDDGSNTLACNTDNDCPFKTAGVRYRCTGVYPALSAGSYLPGMSTSQWPSWNQTLASELKGASLPTDPINRFGANFYLSTPASCRDFPGYDATTCWNERLHTFKCHVGSEVYMYRNQGGTNLNLYGLAEDPGWIWANQDPRITINDDTYGGLCTTNTPVTGFCGNGTVEGTEKCDGGSINYCEWTFKPQTNFNNEFKVGCKSDCTGWADPYNGNVAQAQAACGGACGDGTIDPAYEKCDPKATPTGAQLYTCSAGGSVYCSNTCQVACTAGRPYGGLCGDGKVQLPEVCDDGASNGAAGKCNTSCSGYGNFCGDAVVIPTNEYSISCTCGAVSPACKPGYTGIIDKPCTASCLPAGTPAYEWRCVQNAEECDTVVGLTSYSCPVNTSLYCDSSCNRACSTVDTVPLTGLRNNVPVYEHYYNQQSVEDYDYTLLKKADYLYDTKGIAFYAYPVTTNSLNTTDIYRFKSNTTPDHLLSTQAAAISGYTLVGPAFEAYTQAKGGSINSSRIVPVYEFTAQATAAQGPMNFLAQYKFDSGTVADTTGVYNGTIVGSVPPVSNSIAALGLARSFSGAGAPLTYCERGGTCTTGGARCDNFVIPCAGATGPCVVTNTCSTAAEITACDLFPNPTGFTGCRDHHGRDYIDITQPIVLTSDKTTLAAWFKGATNVPNGYFITLQGAAFEDMIGLSVSGQRVHAMTTLAGTWQQCDAFSTQTVNSNQWYHALLVQDGTNLSLYINGVLDSTTNISGCPFVPVQTGFTAVNNRIGDDVYAWTPGAFNGEIDDVRIYDRALTATEVTSMYQQSLNIQLGSGEHYYSRNSTPRSTAQGAAYIISNGGNPIFHAWEGPFQETCGNDIVEGNETCEAATYQTPAPLQSSVYKQYACGAVFTPNACQTYGGYCGDATKNVPFEQCDLGTGFTCSLTGQSCKTTSCNLSTCNTATSVCALNNTKACTRDSDCANICLGNGALCNNSATNCGYCTNACGQGIVSRNFCGDGITNPGLDGIYGNGDAYEEICDDSVVNNGKSGFCNETCSGQTGAVCGNSAVEAVCSLNTSLACSTAVPCPFGAGTCDGEKCDDGPKNGKWTYTCSNDPTIDCVVNADCGAGNLCNNTPHPYCSFSCLGPTPASCGDTVIQQPNAGPNRIPGDGDDYDEQCDSGLNNGKAGFCNSTCTGITPAVCGDGIVGAGYCSNAINTLCQDSSGCPVGGTCIGGETCDPPASTAVSTCTNNGKPGLLSSQCSATCQLTATQCHAFGLKIWSDAADVAYLNGNLMLLTPVGAAVCLADPALQGASYSSPASPPTGNACPLAVQATEVPYQSALAASDLRPVDSAGNPVAKYFEFNGKNVIAIKVWPQNPTATRGFQAVYASPAANAVYVTESGQTSPWICSNVYTPGWNSITCPDNNGDGRSDCDPTFTGNSWRRAFSYTNNAATPLCATAYPNFVGGNAQWIWGSNCTPTPAVVYCRLEFDVTTVPVQAAWNPNYGWIYTRVAGSQVKFDAATNKLTGAAWNKNLGWLFFDGAPTSAGGTVNPMAGQPVSVDAVTGKFSGSAWGVNYGRVNFSPQQSCDPSLPGNNCSIGYGSRPYVGVSRNPASGVVSGYAWSERAGWIDFSAYSGGVIVIP